MSTDFAIIWQKHAWGNLKQTQLCALYREKLETIFTHTVLTASIIIWSFHIKVQQSHQIQISIK